MDGRSNSTYDLRRLFSAAEATVHSRVPMALFTLAAQEYGIPGRAASLDVRKGLRSQEGPHRPVQGYRPTWI
jgi:hypothetical protein